MPKVRGSVRAGETGAIKGDGSGTRPFGTLAEKGGRNATTEESRRSAGGIAPRPSGGAALLGNDRPSAPVTASMARVQNRPSSAPRGTSGAANAGSFTPVQNNAKANLTGQSVGQSLVLPRGNSSRVAPKTQTGVTGNPVASNKAKSRKLDAFYGRLGGGGY